MGSLTLGEWTATTPTGTLVHDTADDATYPRSLFITPDEVQAQAFASLVATGTPPLTVASTTVVPNLNASLLEGNAAAAFSLASHNHDSAYLGLTAKAADSNMLDGLDSTAFALSGHNHDAVYLPLIGGTLTGTLNAREVHIQQAYTLEMTDAGGTKLTMLSSPGAGRLLVGEDVTELLGLGQAGTDAIYIRGNNIPLQQLNAASTGRYNLLKYNAADDVEVGNTSSGLRLLGDETSPKYNGGNLALSADLASYSLTTHDHDADYAPLSHNHSTLYVDKASWTAKGALMAASAAGTPAVLTVGTNGYPLVANSAISTGLQYAQLTATGIATNAVTEAKINARAVTAGKIFEVTASRLLGRAYGAANGDITHLYGTQITEIGTGGYLGVSDTIEVKANDFIGYYTLTFVNGWLTAKSENITG